MSRPFRVLSLVALTVVCSASGISARQGTPGQPTLARVYVLNAAPAEAVPVKIIDAQPLRVVEVQPLRVTVTGVPAVTSQTQVARQRWEYRTATVARGVDPATVLNALGNDFWETTGVTTTSADGSINIVVKRPRP